MSMTWRERWQQRFSEFLGTPSTMSVSRHLILDSDTAGIPFRAVITVRGEDREWSAFSPPDREVLFNHLRAVAERRTCRFSVVYPLEAQQDANSWLAREVLLGGAGSAEVELFVDEAVLSAGRKILVSRHEAALVEERRRAQVKEWVALRDEVLTDPGLVRLWWLDGRSERLGELVTMGDAFDKVPILLGNASNGSTARAITAVLDDFLSRLTAEQRDLLVHQLGRVFRSYERGDLADGLETLVTENSWGPQSMTVRESRT
jgi:hypothetical protein